MEKEEIYVEVKIYTKNEEKRYRKYFDTKGEAINSFEKTITPWVTGR